MKAKKVKYDDVKFLLKKGASVYMKDASWLTAIDYASAQGHKEIVELLVSQLSNHAYTGASYRLCLSALGHAISGGHSAIVEFLVDSEVVNSHTDHKILLYAVHALLKLSPNSTPFFQLPFLESTAYLLLHKLLSKHHVYINQKDDSSGFTAFQLAIKYGHVAIVELLLKHLVKVSPGVINEKSPQGLTALHLASLHGHIDMVKWLLDIKWLDIWARDAEGYSALDLAKKGKHKEVVELLQPATPSSSCAIL